MSTLSCQLLVCSSTLTEDLYRAFIRPNAKGWELVCFGRAMVLTVAMVAIYIAQDPSSKVLSLVSYAWAGFGASLGPVVLMSLWFKRMTRNGALAGMITGGLTVVVWHHFAFFGLYEILPGFLFGAIAIYLVSRFGSKPSETMMNTFDEVTLKVKQL